MAKIITATVNMEGEDAGVVAIDLTGYQGVGCHAVQEAFTKGLGGDIIEDRRKPEFNTKVVTKVCQTR